MTEQIRTAINVAIAKLERDGDEHGVARDLRQALSVSFAGPEWKNGVPTNLAAAAADAGVWLDLLGRMNAEGRWRFSQTQTSAKLAGCRASLREMLARAATGAVS